MGYNTANYEAQGGAAWVIGGTLTVSSTGQLILTDTVTGTQYSITIENGVLTPVEV